MKDYRLELRVKNNYFLWIMEQRGFISQAELSRACGVHIRAIGDYVNLRKTPLYRRLSVGSSSIYVWRRDITKIAETLGVSPGDLFPPQHLDKALAKRTATLEMSLEEIGRLPGSAVLALEDKTPEDRCADKELGLVLRSALADLDGRTVQILAHRFGLDGRDILTYDELAEQYGITRERVRQIERKAMSRLRERVRNGSTKEGRDLREWLPDRDVSSIPKDKENISSWSP